MIAESADQVPERRRDARYAIHGAAISIRGTYLPLKNISASGMRTLSDVSGMSIGSTVPITLSLPRSSSGRPPHRIPLIAVVIETGKAGLALRYFEPSSNWRRAISRYFSGTLGASSVSSVEDETNPAIEPTDPNALFQDPAIESPASTDDTLYKVLIADDESDIHAISRLALEGFRFDGRGVKLLHAQSGAAAYAILQENPDTAVALIDVVMESEYAGLDLVSRIRDELRNRVIRLVLRTGQAGRAPESEVLVKYAINDYREKSRLTAIGLRTVVHSALSAHRDIAYVQDSHRVNLLELREMTSVILVRMDALSRDAAPPGREDAQELRKGLQNLFDRLNYFLTRIY